MESYPLPTFLKTPIFWAPSLGVSRLAMKHELFLYINCLMQLFVVE